MSPPRAHRRLHHTGRREGLSSTSPTPSSTTGATAGLGARFLSFLSSTRQQGDPVPLLHRTGHHSPPDAAPAMDRILPFLFSCTRENDSLGRVLPATGETSHRRQPATASRLLPLHRGLYCNNNHSTGVIRFLAGLFDKGVLFELDNCCSAFSSAPDFILSKLDCRVVAFSPDSVCFPYESGLASRFSENSMAVSLPYLLLSLFFYLIQ
ncbi:hypothetical protein V8G54_000807 [Vigna mungo]|uniref:Uncharacterized protein n=1 Tax=Vigna mungo TaxID=3915 RepID=A0AAQ3SAD3_VIGMU